MLDKSIVGRKLDFSETFPPSLTIHILSFLTRRECNMLSTVSKRMNEFLSSNYLRNIWKEYISKVFTTASHLHIFEPVCPYEHAIRVEPNRSSFRRVHFVGYHAIISANDIQKDSAPKTIYNYIKRTPKVRYVKQKERRWHDKRR